MNQPIVHFVPLVDIFVDYEWNVRGLRNVMSQESDAVQDTTLQGEHQALGMGLGGLEKTLELRGQDTACVVRPIAAQRTLGGHRSILPVELVCGFRRVTAARNLYEREVAIPGLPPGTIMCLVRELSPVDAIVLNGRENTDRQNLDTPDTLRLISKLLALGLSQTQVAAELGMTYGYVSKLSKICRLPREVLDHWRGDGPLPGLPPITRRLRTPDMLEIERLSATQKLQPNQIVEMYVQRVLPKSAPRESAPQDLVARRVQQVATLLGGMVRMGIVQEGNLDWARVIGPHAEGFLVDTGKIVVSDRARYWAMADRYYKESLNR